MGIFDDEIVQPPPLARFQSSLADDLGISGVCTQTPDTPEGAIFGKLAVKNSDDLKRILALPRRELPDPEPIRRLLIERFAKPGCDRAPFDSQVWMLWEGMTAGGLLGAVGVGHGKTWASMILPMVIKGCQTAVLFIPPNMRAAFAKEWTEESKRWKLPNLAGGENSASWVTGRPVLHVIPYSVLSSPASSTLLKEIRPDTIILDEAHNVRSKEAVRTARFENYLEEFPATRLFVMSGTLTSRSIKDYAHFSRYALREGSPLPLHWATVEEWSTAIDPARKGQWAAPAGELRRFCEVGEKVRDGFSRRLVDTQGVVITKSASVECSLVLRKREVNIPDQIQKQLIELRGADEELDADYQEQHGTWTRPDGEELVTPIQVAATARELASGFFYKWKYPWVQELEGMTKREVIDEWFRYRKAWNKELREKVKLRKEGMDSPALCMKAAIRWFDGYRDPDDRKVQIPPFTKRGPLPTWDAETWQAWEIWHKRVQHETEAQWIDEYLARDAAEWGNTHNGIIWYLNEAFGRKVAELGKMPFYGGGKDASASIIHEKGNRSVVASIHAHGEGKNLQRFSEMLIAELPSSGKVWEQVIGREHRPGQMADVVEVFTYQHTRENIDALAQATEDAKYAQTTLRNPQKLMLAARDL